MRISNYAKTIIFLLLLTAFVSGVSAQTFQQGELIPQQPEPAVGGGSSTDNSGLLILLITAVVVIIVIVVAILSRKKNTKSQQVPQPQQATKALVICPKCYNRIGVENDFCPKCGADIRPKVIQ